MQNFFHTKIIRFVQPRHHSKIIRNILKNVQKKWVCFTILMIKITMDYLINYNENENEK